jgi:hypothetical protein
MEENTDRLEDVADVLRGVIVKISAKADRWFTTCVLWRGDGGDMSAADISS